MGDPIDHEEVDYFYPMGPRSRFREQHGEKSDHVHPTEYRARYVHSFPGMYAPGGPPYYIDAPNSYSQYYGVGIPSWFQPAYNQAYSRLKEKVSGDNAQVGVMFAEWKQSLNMMANRLVQVGNLARNLRNRNFNAAAADLGVGRYGRRTRRSTSRDFANTWLEWSFGWKPMIQDINSGINQLSAEGPKSRVAVRRNGSHNYTVSNPFVFYSGTMAKSVHMGANFKLLNPNVYLAEQIGIINPASVAWELVPFSFVVDWFTDVGSWIDSFSDFAGLDVQNAWTTLLLRFQDTEQYVGGSPANVYGWVAERDNAIASPLPNLQFQANLGNSLNRAANAASLVVQLLTGGSSRGH